MWRRRQGRRSAAVRPAPARWVRISQSVLRSPRPLQPDDPASTHDLARRAQGRPREGFAELYARTAPAIVVWSRVHVREALRSRLDPEDVLQETAARAWQRFGEFDPQRGTFRNWIFGIARNVLLEALQRLGSSSHANAQLATGGLALLPDEATSITRSVARRETLANFARRVDALPREEQRLLLYRGLEERTHDEVAQLLNTSVEAAAKRWQRLRERLLADCGGEDFLAA
jgi:RNA polymerase sigma factor (sigma-70 family)